MVADITLDLYLYDKCDCNLVFNSFLHFIDVQTSTGVTLCDLYVTHTRPHKWPLIDPTSGKCHNIGRNMTRNSFETQDTAILRPWQPKTLMWPALWSLWMTSLGPIGGPTSDHWSILLQERVTNTSMLLIKKMYAFYMGYESDQGQPLCGNIWIPLKCLISNIEPPLRCLTIWFHGQWINLWHNI